MPTKEWVYVVESRWPGAECCMHWNPLQAFRKEASAVSMADSLRNGQTGTKRSAYRVRPILLKD